MNWQQFGEDALFALAGTAALVCAAFLVARRSSQQESEILALLLLGEQYGCELSTIYVRLRSLEEKGFVQSVEDPFVVDYVGIPRRLYTLTERGRRRARGPVS